MEHWLSDEEDTGVPQSSLPAVILASSEFKAIFCRIKLSMGSWSVMRIAFVWQPRAMAKLAILPPAPNSRPRQCQSFDCTEIHLIRACQFGRFGSSYIHGLLSKAVLVMA